MGTNAQNSQGTDFWVAFLQNCDIHNSGSKDYYNLEITVTSKEACNVTIENTVNGFSEKFSLTSNSTKTISIPFDDYNLDKHGVVLNDKSLHVTSTAPISVYISNAQYHSMEASIALPTSSCGSYYVTQMNTVRVPAGAYEYYPAFFCIIATEDDTQVEVIPTLKTGAGYPANIPFTLNLNKGEVYVVETTKDDAGKEFSGSQIRVKDDKKVAVFVGNQSSCIPEPTPSGDGDNICDVAYPVASWGKEFLMVPLQTGKKDLIKITAADKGAIVYLNQNKLVELQPFESYQTIRKESDGAYYINSSEPIEIYQYMTSVNYDGGRDYPNRGMGGPSFQYISPLEQAIDEVTFATFDNWEVKNQYLNIIIKSSDENLVSLDGQTNFETFQSIPNAPGYLYTTVKIANGSHVLKSPNGVIANIYGTGESISYAYSAGSSLSEINPIIQNLTGKYKVTYDGNGASGTMESHTYSIGVDETTKLDANKFDRSCVVTFDTKGGDAIPSEKSGYLFEGWMHENLLTEVSNNMAQNWNNISTDQSETVYDLISLSTSNGVNTISVNPQSSIRERLYSKPIYTPNGDFKLNFKVCSPSGYQDLGSSWDIKFKVAACDQTQATYCNDKGMLTKNEEKSAVLVDCYNSSTTMENREFTIFATGTTPVYLTINCGNLYDGIPCEFKISDYVMTKADGSSMIYADEEFTKNLVREDGGTLSLKATWKPNEITLPLPTKTGYVFNGWNTKADGTGMTFQAGDIYHANVNTVLYAMWTLGCASTHNYLEESICNGEYYTSVTGKTYKTTGEYLDTLVNYKGCDSVVHLKLKVIPVQVNNIIDEIYLNDNYTDNGFYLLNVDELGTFDYTITTIGYEGCDSIINLKLTVKEHPLVIPTAFTPHFKDNLNDQFMPGFEVFIYDRYGNLVCHSDNGWDGTYRGKLATPGVYVYTLVMKDGEHVKGTIEVVKSKK